MATSADVAVAQNGGQANVKLHPYLISLVRWCVSCVWSTASVLLHRLMTTPLQPITGPKPCGRRAPGTEHLNPEPRVECQLLHHPDEIHTMDVIFVHGLYGSLGNTWRQGDWRQKYVADPKIVTLRDHSKQNRCTCHGNSYKNDIYNENKCNASGKNVDNHTRYENMTDLNDPETSFRELNEKLAKKVIPEENDLITEQFYNNTLVDQDNIKNYDTQAKFVQDMFKRETNCDNQYNKECNIFKSDMSRDNEFKCIYNERYDDNSFKCDQNNFKSDNNSDYDYKCKYNENNVCKYNENSEDKCNENKYNENNEFKYNENNESNSNENNECKYSENKDCKYNEYKCNEYKYNENNDIKYNENNECKCNKEKNCETGCGCTCNSCYSLCWPRDWIKADFPGARVISINYTSDPYLWRPLWIKENKRLNLYQRAEQMIEQLLEMGVGEKPIIWVGHSKGGLFIKQIYCEAYEAYLKINKNFRKNDKNNSAIFAKMEETYTELNNGITADNIDTIIGHFSHKETIEDDQITNDDHFRENNDFTRVNDNYTRLHDNFAKTNDNLKGINDNHPRNGYYIRNDKINNNACVMDKVDECNNIFEQMTTNDNNLNEINDNIRNLRIENGEGDSGEELEDVKLWKHDLTSSIEASLSSRASLWLSSRGFMFYSVPHRGSPLADIKTPITARSVDLLEIAKDCPLVVELQSRWQRAMGPGGTVPGARPAVRGVVETCRTLMSVVWLRIVSTESADAGFGTLSGISVDHREICKPTSRACPLYTMLKDLIYEATTCTCQ